MRIAPTPAAHIQSDINITPLVDVVLVLLIIFMVAQPMLQRGYDSFIPTSEKKEEVDVAPSFVLRLSHDHATGTLGAIALNTETIQRAELLEKVQHAMLTVAGPRDKVVFIDCADEVNYDELMQVVDVLKAAGVITVGFATEPIPQ